MTIEEMRKGGHLKEIEIDKVSLVKSPANQRRFIITKAEDLEFIIRTDRTFKGTSLTVDGEEIENLDGFYFSLSDYSEEDMESWGASPVSMTFTTRKPSENGLDVVEMVSLHSEVEKQMEKADVIKVIKELGIELDEAGFDKLSVDIQKACAGIAVFSKAMVGQPVFRDSVVALMKSATEMPTETEPNADTDPKPDPDADPKPDSDPNPDAVTLTDIQARLKALEEKAAKPSEGQKDPPDSPDDAQAVTKADIEKFTELLNATAKAAGVKQSGEIDINKGDPGKDDWASWKI